MRGLIARGTVAAGAALALLIPAAAASASSPPVLGWSPTTTAVTYNYGTVPPGSATPQTFTLKNSGGSAIAALTVIVIGSAAFTKSADTCTGTSLGPGKSCTVKVTYSPAAPGQADRAALTATSPDPVTEARLTLAGTVAKATPAIATAQQPASATAGTAVADQATVSGGFNPTGTVTFNLYGNPNCTSPPLFTDTEPLTGGTAASAGFTATATGTVTDYWTATYNGDSSNNAVTSGCAAEPVTIIGGTPNLTLSPGGFIEDADGTNEYRYSFQVPNGSSKTTTFTITNSGSGASQTLHLASDDYLGFYTAHDMCTGHALAPGATCTFGVTYSCVGIADEPNGPLLVLAPAPTRPYILLNESGECPGKSMGVDEAP